MGSYSRKVERIFIDVRVEPLKFKGVRIRVEIEGLDYQLISPDRARELELESM